MVIDLKELGWSPALAHNFRQLDKTGLMPARISGKTRNSFQVMGEFGEAAADTRKGAYAGSPAGLSPVVGDWTGVRIGISGQNNVIEAVLPRKNKISRQISGGRERYSGGMTAEQVIAANVDMAFIVCSLDGSRNLNQSKIERYLTLARASDASPVIILNKMDLCADVQNQITMVRQVAPEVPVLAVSAARAEGLDGLKQYLTIGSTAVFLGPSGVGKSSIINALLGTERLKVGAVRDGDFRGRHTTTGQELLRLPGGSMVIDTPGLREIQLWADDEDIKGIFPDIDSLALRCRFRDCTHNTEPGCAVQQAIEEGVLGTRRLENYRKLGKELQYQEARQNDAAGVVEKKKWKEISQWQKDFNNNNR